MLKKILNLLSTKGVVSLKELSEEVGQSEEFVKLLLEELEKRGKIKCCTVNPEGCDRCPIKAKCGKKESGVVYFITKS